MHMYVHTNTSCYRAYGSVGPEALWLVQCPRCKASDPGSQAQGQRLKAGKPVKQTVMYCYPIASNFL